ncbi:MAG: radical SAM family heme chaperone HemW [Verrucomicrobia bacterium]|nr:radical SAM family heme chaperone HemW [Verrucomicrobiota bacterium]
MKTTEPNLNLLRGVPASGREVESFAPSPVKADNSPPPAGVVTSLYVHVPFCAHKCEYCAFYSHLPGGDGVDRYVAALTEEMRMVADGTRLKTVFFGGGTPSILNLRQWEKVFHTMDKVGWLGADEWTVECNPATVSLDKAKLLREFGVNRISMGVQSLDEALLDRLGRIHSREMVFKSYDILRKAGFENINIDLMFAIPGQTMPIWEATMNEAMAMQTEHLSCYEVIYEEDTPLFAQLQAGEIDVDEELACDMYERLVARAQEGGYERYEVANFAKGSGSGEVPSRACRHNVNYWEVFTGHWDLARPVLNLGSARNGGCVPVIGRIRPCIVNRLRKGSEHLNRWNRFHKCGGQERSLLSDFVCLSGGHLLPSRP